MGKKQEYINRTISIMESIKQLNEEIGLEDVGPWSVDQQRGIEYNLISSFQLLDNVQAILTFDMMFSDEISEG